MCFLSDWWEAFVLFTTYLWGKPQPPIFWGNAEGEDSPVDTSLKRPGREPWNGRKYIKVLLIIKAFTPGLTPGFSTDYG